jgi:hypothetical protein
MTPNEEIEKYRKDYLNKSDTDLLLVTHRIVPSGSAHIAAAQIIEERRKAVIDKQTAIGKRTKSYTLIILILTILLLIIAIAQLIKSV